MEGTNENNNIVKKFRFLDRKLEEVAEEKLTKAETTYIQNNFVNKNGTISFKNSGVFKLSDLEVMTNPIQLDKVMDNYYFNLDSNAKKFIEFITTQWN